LLEFVFGFLITPPPPPKKKKSSLNKKNPALHYEKNIFMSYLNSTNISETTQIEG
jgi:hypothetical protein